MGTIIVFLILAMINFVSAFIEKRRSWKIAHFTVSFICIGVVIIGIIFQPFTKGLF